MSERIAGMALLREESMKNHTTLRAGGPAEFFCSVNTGNDFASVCSECQKQGVKMFVLGGGSNILVADQGISGLVVKNRARAIIQTSPTTFVVDSGAAFQDVFLKAAQAGLTGLEFAVGIPGSIGGALVSNAGAYRSNISDLVTRVEVAAGGSCTWMPASWMEFSYRDSVLRRPNPPEAVVTRIELSLKPGDPATIYNTARKWQIERIRKQPPMASAGSFFKNVEDAAFALTVVGLPQSLRDAGVVPAGYLIEGCGIKGHSMGGAAFSGRHANFLVNKGGATATEIWILAQYAKTMVEQKYSVTLHEEVLRVGNW